MCDLSGEIFTTSKRMKLFTQNLYIVLNENVITYILEITKLPLPNWKDNEIIHKMIEDFVESLHEEYPRRYLKIKVT